MQSIPVSEMEKMIAAAEVDLERASENYEKFLVASEGKGRCAVAGRAGKAAVPTMLLSRIMLQASYTLPTP